MSDSPHLLVRAALGQATPRPPVWAMRQAGRWDPEFNKIRTGHSFYEFSENVELSAKCSACVHSVVPSSDVTIRRSESPAGNTGAYAV